MKKAINEQELEARFVLLENIYKVSIASEDEITESEPSPFEGYSEEPEEHVNSESYDVAPV